MMKTMGALSLKVLRISPLAIALVAAARVDAQVTVPASQDPGQSQASVPDDSDALGDIVVTAQKREQALNDVPMSISALSGDQLAKSGVSDIRDLVKLVPGFNYTESAFGTPVYTLRGIGFYETSLGAKPTVSVYVDEVPLPFSVLTRGATLDLQRVEVLKGPQGTLFGQNATGGAINYIAAKPTSSFEAGVDGSYGRFNAIDLGGFISGPLSDTLSARLSVKTEQGGAWQRSYTRDDELGDRNFTTARLLFDFRPSDTLRFELNLNGFLDKGDEVAAQLLQVIPFTPAVAPLVPPELYAYPVAPHDNRAADWTPAVDPSRNHRFLQASLRSEVDLIIWPLVVTLKYILAIVISADDSIQTICNLTFNTQLLREGSNITRCSVTVISQRHAVWIDALAMSVVGICAD